MDVQKDLELRLGVAAGGEGLQHLSRLSTEVFEFDFDQWVAHGFVDPAYYPLSLFHDGVMVSNVSAYSMELVVDGARVRALQFSTCATLKAYRGRGLATRLLDLALDRFRSEHDLVFLFSTDNARPLYQRLGFVPVVEACPSVTAPQVGGRPGARRLDLDSPEDLELLVRYAKTRAPVSGRLGVLNAPLLLFHGLHALRERLYYLHELACIVACAPREGGTLRIYDVIGPRIPPFRDLYPFLLGKHHPHTVEFMFLPDKLEVTGLQWTQIPENNLHILGGSPFNEKQIMFPFTAQA